MHKLIGMLVVVACAMLLGPAQAAEPATTFDYFTLENVHAALTALGATDIKSADVGGQRGFTAEIGGYTVAMNIQHCESGGCTGFLIGAAFDTEGRDIPAETLIAFTRKYPPTPALKSGKDVAILRALISNGGVTSANLQANIALLVALIPAFANHVNEATIASNQAGAPALMRSHAPLRQILLTPSQMKEWQLP